MIKKALKRLYLGVLSHFPHNNIYEFHHVSSHPAVDLSPRKLDTEAFFRFVENHGPYLSLERITREKALKHYAAITFDDGLEDVYTIAYPYLARRGIPFTAFVLSGKIGQPGYLTKEQLMEMAANPLVTIGLHGVDHTKLSEVDEETQRREVEGSKKQVELLLNQKSNYFAYPFGLYNKVTLRTIKHAGYKHAYAVKGRPLLPWNDRKYEIPRLSIENGTLWYYDRF